HYYPYTVDEIRSKSRHKDISFVRHLSMFLIKKMTEKSLRDIGRLFGGRDHATVLHGLDNIERYIAANPSAQHTIRQIESEIKKPFC
ncbi:MAG: helix-turn-helix domain-containing protein, partial [Gammaproteobacteria bacterium]|nr:helix-turn-helix domain-containing protein [Gammaproteobacteria bacterium]